MKYGIFFLILAIALATSALMMRGGYWILMWPALSCGLVAAAYLAWGVSVFGKRADGTMSPISILCLLPYLLFMWSIWHLMRMFSREPATSSVSEDVLIGRRLLPKELPPDVEVVVDLTCEFVEPGPIRNRNVYVAFPILDASAPEPQVLTDQVQWLARQNKKILIHCALGHGRSGLVAALLLMAKNAVKFDMAVALVKNSRPGVELNRQQMAALKESARMIDVENASGIH